MQTQLRITFHQMEPSPALEDTARACLADLEAVFGHMITCRVSIEGPHHHAHGQPFRVVVDIGVPGRHIVVGTSPDDRVADADAHLAVREAFRAARRRLEAHAHRDRPARA